MYIKMKSDKSNSEFRYVLRKLYAITIICVVTLTACSHSETVDDTKSEASAVTDIAEVSQTKANDARSMADASENQASNVIITSEALTHYGSEATNDSQFFSIEEIYEKNACEEYTLYGRILFVGDSRTIDMFYDSDENFFGEIHDNIAVYGGHGKGLDFMKTAVEEYGSDNYDTLVSWMGANEGGRFEGYGEFYDSILADGKTLVLCTVGPTDERYLDYEYEGNYYLDSLMQEYNRSLMGWADSRGVRIIDLYGFIKGSQTVTLDPVDGIHYLPRPTYEVWNHIVKELSIPPNE